MHKRNVEGLRINAQRRHQDAVQKASAVIRSMQREGRAINFKTVSEASGLSTAWLYRQEDINHCIRQLRTNNPRYAPAPISHKEQVSGAAKDAVILALRERVQKLEEENKVLRRKVEIAYGQLYATKATLYTT